MTCNYICYQLLLQPALMVFSSLTKQAFTNVHTYVCKWARLATCTVWWWFNIYVVVIFVVLYAWCVCVCVCVRGVCVCVCARACACVCACIWIWCVLCVWCGMMCGVQYCVAVVHDVCGGNQCCRCGSTYYWCDLYTHCGIASTVCVCGVMHLHLWWPTWCTYIWGSIYVYDLRHLNK